VKTNQRIKITGAPGMTMGDVNQTVGGVGDGGHIDEKPHVIRVLFLAANPEGTAALRLDQEVKAISEAIRCSHLGPYFEVRQSWAVGDRELQDGILRWQPDIVHLSGHGAPGGRLLLEDDPLLRDLGGHLPLAGRPSEVDPQVHALAQVFAAARGHIRCLVLNACHSEAAAQAIAQQVGCVVGMSQSVADAAAIRFSWAFYNALGYGLSVKAAFEMGTAQMGMISQDQGEIPRLLVAGVDPATVVFGAGLP
jgi:hypothetical protein